MIFYRFAPISSQKGVLFLRHPVVLEFLKILAFLVLVSYKPVSYKKSVYSCSYKLNSYSMKFEDSPIADLLLIT